jgi:cytochrome c biogenesis protein CcdA
MYVGFLLSYTLLYFGLTLFKNIQNNTISNFSLIILFSLLIIHSFLLVLDITFIELLKGIKIKSFKISQLTSLFFGIKFSFLQILSNPIFFIILIINIFQLSSNTNSLNNIGLYVLGLVVATHTITKLSNNNYIWLIQKINYKQKLINIISSIGTIIISFIFISNLI